VPEGLLLVAALLSSTAGMAWLALGMKVHWRQACGGRVASSTATTRTLRIAGGFALAGSLFLCLAADHPSIAVLVWVMSLAAAALAVAFALTWRPRVLALLVPGMKR
jgi:Protein of unknown function (DUF3325)